jgi:uncharacterized protein YrrD
MKFTYGASVYSSDQKELGILDELVIEPRSRVVTHIVVQRGLLFLSDRLIPADLITEITDEGVFLSRSADELDKELSAEYESSNYIPLQDEDVADRFGVGARVWARPATAGLGDMPYPPIVPPGIGPLPSALGTPIPLTEISLEKGSLVRSADGKKIGKVEKCITDDNENITHMLIREGVLFTEPKLVPVDWIMHIKEDEIVLAVTAKVVEQLPEPTEEQ